MPGGRAQQVFPIKSLLLSIIVTWLLVGQPLRTLATDAPQPFQVSDTFFADTIAYMDKLKDCAPSTSKMTVNFLGKEIKTALIIRGRKDDHCLVDKVYNGILTEQCAYTPESIKSLTSQAKYDEAKAKRVQASTSDLEETHDCKMVAQPVTAKGAPPGSAAAPANASGRKDLRLSMKETFTKVRNASGELLDEKATRRMLSRVSLDQIMACAVKSQERHAPIANFASAFQVDQSGNPTAVKFAPNTLDAATLACISKAIQSWSLHVPATGAPFRVHIMINMQEG